MTSASSVPSSSSAPTSSADNLEVIRSAIDDIDSQIVALIARREQWVRKAGAAKNDDTEVPDPARVERVIGKVRDRATHHGADAEVVEATYRAMIGAFIELELRSRSGR